MFFKYNTALGPPYRVLLDTNFINFSIKNKLDIVNAGMDCLLAKVIPCVTDCVMAELEKLGPKYRVALKCVRVGRARGGWHARSGVRGAHPGQHARVCPPAPVRPVPQRKARPPRSARPLQSR